MSTERPQAAVEAAEIRRAAETHRIIKGRRWRVSDPCLDDELRQLLVNALMDARRTVKQALSEDGNDDQSSEASLAAARRRVADAKVALGERGPKWWEAMSVDEVGERVECALRSLASVGEVVDDDDESRALRRRLRL